MHGLLSWDLNKLYSEVVNPILHQFKVLLHPFIFVVIISVDLTGYHLGIAVYNQISSSHGPGKVHPYYQGFILYFIIGCREIQTDHAFDFISFWAKEYYTSSTYLLIGGSVYVDAPL